ncbi:unknown [Oscillibacter sp. CAG:155]|nr:unknown [Oscillibacter sp. CAG:155]
MGRCLRRLPHLEPQPDADPGGLLRLFAQRALHPVVLQPAQSDIIRCINRQQVAGKRSGTHIQECPIHGRQTSFTVLRQSPPPVSVSCYGSRRSRFRCRWRSGRLSDSGLYSGRVLRNFKDPLSQILRHGRLFRQRRLLPRGLIHRRGWHLGNRTLFRGSSSPFPERFGSRRFPVQLCCLTTFGNGTVNQLPTGDALLQPLNPGLQGRQIPGEGLITQPQQTQLCVRAAIGAVIKVSGGLLQGGCQINQPDGGDILPQLVQRGAVISAGEQRRAAFRGGPPQQQIPDQRAQFSQYGAYILAATVKLVQLQQSCFCIPVQNLFHQPGRLEISRKAQHLQHSRRIDGAARGSTLIQKAQSIPQCAVRQTAEQFRPVRRQGDALLPGHVCQAGCNILGCDALKGKALAPGQNGGRHLVELRSGQNKHQMFRRLFQNL